MTNISHQGNRFIETGNYVSLNSGKYVTLTLKTVSSVRLMSTYVIISTWVSNENFIDVTVISC